METQIDRQDPRTPEGNVRLETAVNVEFGGGRARPGERNWSELGGRILHAARAAAAIHLCIGRDGAPADGRPTREAMA